MLKFYSNENFPIEMVALLRTRGYKVQVLYDFFTQDTQPMNNRLIRVMKQNIKGSQQTFILQEYPKYS